MKERADLIIESEWPPNPPDPEALKKLLPHQQRD